MLWPSKKRRKGQRGLEIEFQDLPQNGEVGPTHENGEVSPTLETLEVCPAK